MRKDLQQFLFITLLSLLVVSCEKEEEQFPPFTPAQKTLIKFPQAGNLVLLSLEASAGYSTVDILQIERNAVSPADLQKTRVVRVRKNITVLVELGGGAVTEMPESVYRANSENPFDGQAWTVTFQPGESVKYLKLYIDAIALASYGRVGMGFQLAEAPDAQMSTTMNQAAVELEAKNEFDGIYSVNGTFFHPASADLTGDFGTSTTGGTLECELITSGSSSVIRNYGAPVGESVLVWNHTAGIYTYFSGVKPRFSVNANNTVNVTPAPGTIAFDPSPFNCDYNPSTRTFTLNYAWTSTGGQRVITEYLVYSRPR